MTIISKTITAALFLSSSIVGAKEMANQSPFDVQLNLGGAYTSVNDFDGEGYQASLQVDFPLDITDLQVYGRVKTQSTHDKKANETYYLDENELVLGMRYQVEDNILLFLEGGDLKHSFETDTSLIDKEYLNVSRVGIVSVVDDYRINVALENRDGDKADLGYRTMLTYGSFSFSYTDVGEYQSFTFSIQHQF